MITLRSYITGFVLSLIITALSFGAMWMHYYTRHAWPGHDALAVSFILLAVIQLVVQLVYFLHIGRHSKSANLVMLGLAVFIVSTVVGGSLWIMSNLQHNNPAMQTYLNGLINPQHEND